MGSGVWFKNIISKKKVKGDRSQKLKRYSAPGNIFGCKEGCVLEKARPVDNQVNKLGDTIEDAAATRIQTAYRSHLVRKTFHQMRGMIRLRNLVKCDSVKKQASTTLSHLHSWSKIQTQIRVRRVQMVTEGQLRQKKLENQLKHDAKIHDLEVEWSGGSETMDKALAKIHQREEAAVRRERAMAYAFSHQWRANSNPSFASSHNELSKENWGWSWTDRWVVARPWENRAPVRDSPKKTSNRQLTKTGKYSISPSSKTSAKVKLISPNGKVVTKARKLSFEAAGHKPASQKLNTKSNGEKSKNEQEVSDI